jgi:hypothetical protein
MLGNKELFWMLLKHGASIDFLYDDDYVCITKEKQEEKQKERKCVRTYLFTDCIALGSVK